jgi:8-oxo-dGTP pyrophosphatase MutT (NUDIX family)
MRDDKALFIRKEEGFGSGKLNVPGGKLEEGETPEACAAREVFEETGLALSHLRRHGVLNFYFGEKDEPDWIVHVFSSTSFSGELKRSSEGPLEWVDLDKLPFDEMWEDDRHWVPLLLEDKAFSGDFYFNEAGDKLLRYSLSEVKPFD